MSDDIQAARNFLFGRQDDYKATFGAPVAHSVLEDLARFCRAHDTTFHPDPRVHALLEGRREVWNRIAHHLNLTPEQLWELYNRSRPSTGDKP